MLRGIQFTDDNGVAQFVSIFPGHYAGRTNHVHVMSSLNATVRPNNTISGGTVAHVGQLYFDQSLIDEVEKTAPYNTNKEFKMTNNWDFLLGMGSQGAADPVVEYVLLGPKIEDGIFAWVNFGIDQRLARTVRTAAHCDEKGCTSSPLPDFWSIFGFGSPKPPGGAPGASFDWSSIFGGPKAPGGPPGAGSPPGASFDWSGMLGSFFGAPGAPAAPKAPEAVPKQPVRVYLEVFCTL